MVVDGDASGGPLIDKAHREFWIPEEVGAGTAVPDERISRDEAHWAIHGVQAQNYHIFTPALDKDWCMAWGCADVDQGISVGQRRLLLQFQAGRGRQADAGILGSRRSTTPGPKVRSAPSNRCCARTRSSACAWAVMDYGDVNREAAQRVLEPLAQAHDVRQCLGAVRVQAHAARTAVPQGHRGALVAARSWTWTAGWSRSRICRVGKITGWKWDFGDGATSTEQNPMHQYAQAGPLCRHPRRHGPDGNSRHSKVWDISLR